MRTIPQSHPPYQECKGPVTDARPAAARARKVSQIEPRGFMALPMCGEDKSRLTEPLCDHCRVYGIGCCEAPQTGQPS
jgi:hypothetical protein